MSRTAIILSVLAFSALSTEPAWHDNGAAFIWNASASVPIGMYRLVAPAPIDIGDLVVVKPPPSLASFLAKRGYLPRGVPLVKRVAAISGAKVCRNGMSVTVDDHISETAIERDSRGRLLPAWQGCRTLAADEVFLMNVGVTDSLDGRYFGPLPVTTITARALPVFTDDDGDGHFHWHLGDLARAPRASSQPPAQELSHGTDR